MSHFTRLALVLIIITTALYWRVQGHWFVNYDDPAYVQGNLHVKSGLCRENIRWAFTAFHSANWHPVTWISHMTDCQLFGMDARRHHTTNLAIHAANAFLLFYLLNRMTGALWRSALVAALFAWHPLHVESVAWISERKDLLCGFFWFLTCIAHQWYAQKRSVSRYFLVIAAFLGALMSKPMAVTLPCILLILDYWPLRRMQEGERSFSLPKAWKLVVEKIPLFLLSLAACYVTIQAQHAGNAIRSVADVSFGARLENTVIGYAWYLSKMVWPQNLAVLYPLEKSWPAWKLIVSTLALLLITIGVFRMRKFPYLRAGWIWYGVTLLPVIGLVQVGFQAYADRYSYLPLIGPFIILTWGSHDLVATYFPRSLTIELPWVWTGILFAFCLATEHEVPYWRDSVTLFERTLAVTDENYVIHCHLATSYFSRKQADAAEAHLKESLRIEPKFPESRSNYATLLSDQGKNDEALAVLQGLESENPADGIEINLVSLLMQMRRPEEAIEQCRKWVARDPANSKAKEELAKTLYFTGKTEEAVALLREIVAHDPRAATAHCYLGYALQNAGKVQEALQEYDAAIRYVPALGLAHEWKGLLLIEQKRFTEARGELLTVTRFEPESRPRIEKILRTISATSKTEE